jgi:hypothetical protein
MKVYKQNLEREIANSRWAEYSAGGWKQSPADQAEEVIILKPTAKVKAAVEQANDETITTQGEE